MFDKVVSHANWVIAKAVSVSLEFAANASAVSILGRLLVQVTLKSTVMVLSRPIWLSGQQRLLLGTFVAVLWMAMRSHSLVRFLNLLKLERCRWR